MNTDSDAAEFKGKQIKFLIWPNERKKIRWDLLIMLFSLFNCFTIPIEVAFELPFMKSPTIQVFNYIIDIIFFMDICIAFRTVYIDPIGNEEVNPKAIAWQYLRTTFIIDFLATVPFDLILRLFESYKEYIRNI